MRVRRPGSVGEDRGWQRVERARENWRGWEWPVDDWRGPGTAGEGEKGEEELERAEERRGVPRVVVGRQERVGDSHQCCHNVILAFV